MLAARALGRLAGLTGGQLATPACPPARAALAALLTEALAARLAEMDLRALLQDLNGSLLTPQVGRLPALSNSITLRETLRLQIGRLCHRNIANITLKTSQVQNSPVQGVQLAFGGIGLACE